MDQVMNDPGEYQPEMKILRMRQEARIIAVCESKDGTEFELIVDSNSRALPVPYTEEP